MDLATQARAASGGPTVGGPLTRVCGTFGRDIMPLRSRRGRGGRALRHARQYYNATRETGGHSSPRKPRAKSHCRQYHPPAVVSSRESQWVKRQREIASENERMERRLKAIREAAPRQDMALDKTVAAQAQGRRIFERRDHRQRRGRGEGQTTAPRGIGNSGPTREGLAEAAEANRCGRGLYVFYGLPGKGAGAQRENEKEKNEEVEEDEEEEVRWGALYKRRKALALATEKAATEAAEVRARVEGLRVKILWTKENTRRWWRISVGEGGTGRGRAGWESSQRDRTSILNWVAWNHFYLLRSLWKSLVSLSLAGLARETRSSNNALRRLHLENSFLGLSYSPGLRVSIPSPFPPSHPFRTPSRKTENAPRPVEKRPNMDISPCVPHHRFHCFERSLTLSTAAFPL